MLPAVGILSSFALPRCHMRCSLMQAGHHGGRGKGLGRSQFICTPQAPHEVQPGMVRRQGEGKGRGKMGIAAHFHILHAIPSRVPGRGRGGGKEDFQLTSMYCMPYPAGYQGGGGRRDNRGRQDLS